MTRFVPLLIAALLPSAAHAACVYSGSPATYVRCVAEEAAEALHLAQGGCPDGYDRIGSACVDRTCRGPGEAADPDVSTWSGARSRCNDLGGRLCSASEMYDLVGAGCDFDREFVAIDAGTARLMWRGGITQPDGSCATTDYAGDHYDALYDGLDAADALCTPRQTTLVDDRIDGFMCCAR